MRPYSNQNTVATLDAVGESCAIVGRLSLSDKGSAKSLVNAKLWFRNGTSTLTSASTTLRFGVQDLSATGIEDGTFDVYVDILGNSALVTSNTWQFVTLSSGSKNVSHGDALAIAVEMTARGATDIYRHAGISASLSNILYPYTTVDSGAGPTKLSVQNLPSFLIEFSDGEIGKIDQAFPWTDPGQTGAGTTSQTGMYFVAPFTGNMRKVEIGCPDSIATTDVVVITIWEDPLGARTSLLTTSFTGNDISGAGQGQFITMMLPSNVSLVAGTTYGITLHTTAGAINYSFVSLGAASESNLKKITPFGENMGYISRSSPFTGVFTAVDYYIPSIGFYMDSIDIGSAGASGGNFTFG